MKLTNLKEKKRKKSITIEVIEEKEHLQIYSK